MNLSLFLPGAVVLLKAIFKVSIDRPVSGVSIVKSLIFFPVDITFLAFSYVVARLVVEAPPANDAIRYTIIVVVLFIIAAVVVSIGCSIADRLYDARKAIRAAVLAALTLFVSLAVLISSTILAW